ncbi:MAG: zeta toxin family protein [Alphaproteobacteria bacterium]|nr:zeta toxin family protein [Alphaproteobacteria bacterium]
MQSVINKILAPYSELSKIFPPDIDLRAIKQEIRNAVKHALEGIAPVEKPYLINICGLPASGKSCLCKAFKTVHKEILYISFDALMEDLPTYLSEHVKDRQRSFERWELPARFIGYQLLKQAVKHKLPILFEHSNATPYHIELYEKIKQAGYTVDIRYINADLELVLPRLEKRERYFSAQNTRARASALQEILPVLEKNADHFSILRPWRDS